MAKRSRWAAIRQGADPADIWILTDGRGAELRLGPVTAAEAKRAAGRMNREVTRGRGEYIRAWHSEQAESAVGYLTGDTPDEQPPPRTALGSMQLEDRREQQIGVTPETAAGLVLLAIDSRPRLR